MISLLEGKDFEIKCPKENIISKYIILAKEIKVIIFKQLTTNNNLYNRKKSTYLSSVSYHYD